MIAASPHKGQPATPDLLAPPAWRAELAAAVTDARELCALLELDPERAGVADTAFPVRVPRAYVARMRRGDYTDPLLRQVLGTRAELQPAEGYGSDPLDEAAVRKAPGLIQKYAGRALLITTAACGVHCRYCFRREFPYDEHQGDGARWQAALEALAADTSISEVILSGGDPLSLSDARLRALTERLRGMAHVRRLRIHTRQPVVLPSRVDAGLLGWLRQLPWPCAIVLHANHANELDAAVHQACAALRDTGATLLNQSVLLAGVNDSVEALGCLSEALWDAGVLPYYLHLLDRVRGASHFEVGEARALALLGGLRARLPGYLVPRLAREVPGAAAKIVLA